MSTIQKITTDNPPQFPCWLKQVGATPTWKRYTEKAHDCGLKTHWSPDAPTAPTDSPTATPRTDAYEEIPFDLKHPNWWDFARTLERELTARETAIDVLAAMGFGLRKELDAMGAQLAAEEADVMKCETIIDGLNAEIAELTQDYGHLKLDMNHLADLSETLTNQLAAARKDGNRMDWLEKHCRGELAYGVQTVSFHTPPQNTDDYEKPTVRSAIDAAMQGGEK